MTTTNELRAAILQKVARRPGNWSQKIDIALDVSVGVLTTLKGVAKISAAPFLSNAASIALSIVDVVQKMRSNRHSFRELAKDSCEVVYQIIHAHNDVSKLGGVSVDLERNLGQLLNILRSILEFARKGASRNVFVAMLRYNADARRIQDYQRKLYQMIHIFGLQSHSSVRKTVAQLAGNQVAMANQLNSITAPVLVFPIIPSCMFPSLPDILWRAPRNSTSNLVFRTLSHLENIPVISKHKTKQDKNPTELRAKHGLVPLPSNNLKLLPAPL